MVAVNAVIGLALVGVGVATWVSISGARSSNTAVARTVTVSRGALTATVTATGNAASVSRVAVEASGTSGTVTAVYVKVGQHVSRDQKLVQLDKTDAQDALKTARAGLASARAGLETTLTGRTAAERAQDAASVASAQTSLRNARTALSQDRASYALDQKQQRRLVQEAKDALADAEDPGSSGDSDDPSGSSSSNASAVTSAKRALTSAEQSRDSTLLKDRQSIQTAEGQVRSAQDGLGSAQASASVNAEPPKPGDVASAQAQVDSAEVTVAQAKRTLANTTVRAPAAGTVAAVSAVAGESSSGSSSSSGSTGSSSGSGSSGSGSSTSSTSTSSSSGSSGLVVLTDVARKQVTAEVAEADIGKIKVGQRVQVTFAASSTTVPGTVTAIDTESTVTSNVVQYGVTVALTSDASKIRIGQSASLTITTATKANVLTVPTSAITTVGTRSTVTRRAGGQDTVVPIQTGLVGAAGTEVTSGLAEGDVVVLPTPSSNATSITFPGAGGVGRAVGGR